MALLLTVRNYTKEVIEVTKMFKLYGQKYKLEPTSTEPAIGFGFRNEIVYEVPKGKRVGYVQTEDGSIIECYKKFNPAIVICPTLCVILAGGGVFAYLMFGQPKDVVGLNDESIKEGTDNNVVMYNGFTAINDGQLDIDFTNGSQEATLEIIADGVTVNKITAAPDEYIAAVPATFDTGKGVVNAQLKITTATSENTLDMVIEIPENNTPDSYPEGLDSYWKGEFVYGE